MPEQNDATTCPTCGTPVRVVTHEVSNFLNEVVEVTNHYEPLWRERVAALVEEGDKMSAELHYLSLGGVSEEDSASVLRLRAEWRCAKAAKEATDAAN